MKTDVLILGAGPAGLQAGIHAARKKASVTIVGKASGSALSGTEIENYFGTGAMDGDELLKIGQQQAESFGCTIVRQNVVSCVPEAGGFTATLESDRKIHAKAVVLATGIFRRKLGIPGEKQFMGKGVSYCANCDCNFYKGVPVMIVGNESEAAISAEMMTGYASKVYWATNRTDVDDTLMERVRAAGVEVIDAFPTEIIGKDKVAAVTMKNGSLYDVVGVFIELGGRSSADLAMDLGLMPDLEDTIKVGRNGSTEVPGVFACGDITGRPWQLAKAVGEGAVAGMAAADYAREQH